MRWAAFGVNYEAHGKDLTPSAACHLLSRWFLAQLIFDPEDGGDMFLPNVG
jgi:lysyl-tRNA synthetase class I